MSHYYRYLFAFMLLVPVHSAMAQDMNMTMPGMNMAKTLGFSSSGTSLEPQSSTDLGAIHRTLGGWNLMFHANAAVASTQQTGPRGHDKLFSTNWFMSMLTHQYGRQFLTLKAMLSLEPLTVRKRRYPELFQTGETAYGLPIVDGQHPHDLFMELAARYQFRASDRLQLFVYGGPLGEPALGPPAYSHRRSASEDPVAALGHHEQDSTHISDSVVTLGMVAGPLQLEASTFHGREPDENRWNIDGGRPDSFSSRLTVAANRSLTGQFSIGRINKREALDPDVDTLRTTASIHHNVEFEFGHVASSLIWGRNKDLAPGGPWIFNAYTLESTVNFYAHNWVWTRIENVDRDRTLLAGEVPAALQVEESPIARVQAYTFGYERDLPRMISFINVGLGIQATGYGVPLVLQTVYGGHPRSIVAFLRLRPAGD